MTFAELITGIRGPYVAALAAAAVDADAEVEPAFRTASGALALEGQPPLKAQREPGTQAIALERHS